MYQNKLIYGKNQERHIVNCEAIDEGLVLFREVQGELLAEVIDNKYWLITNKQVSTSQTRLAGNQFYKYLATFDTEEQKTEAKKKLYKNRIDFYHINDPKEASLVYNGLTYHKGLKPKDVSILSFDIETDNLKLTPNSEIYLITNTFRKQNKIINKTFSLENYNSQADMLIDWCNWVQEIDPTILCGHNIYVYDFQYLNHVAQLNDIELKLGRDGSPIRFNTYTSKKRKDGSQEYEYYKAYIFGREIIDTFFLSLTYDISRQFESYGLKPIIKHLGFEKEGRSFVDASKIKKYYNERTTNPEMWTKVKLYGEQDSDDALKIYDYMIPAFFYLTQHISKSFTEMINSATGSQINNFLVRSYLQDNYSIPKATEITEKIEGGISFAIPNIYRNLYKIDLRSCYPSQILRFKLYDTNKDPKAYYYQMVEHFAKERFELKRLYKETGDQYYKDRDGVAKVFLNSAYGLSITTGLNFNSPSIGKKITFESREVIDLALKWASGQGKDYWMHKFKEITGKLDESEL